MVSRSRMPPPSCTGISSPTSRRIALIAASLTGLPAKAPFRSTRCRRRAPASSQRRAIAAGSSLKVVAWSMSPCFRRTQWPSLRSIAGISSMAEAGVETAAVERERRSSRASRVPVQEVAVEGQAVVGALLGVELGRKNIIARQRAGKARAVLGFADAVARVRRPGVEAVHEIEVAAVGHARPERVRPRLRAPGSSPSAAPCSGCRRAAAGRRAGSARTSPGIRPRPSVGPLLAAIEQHLHADAHAQQRLVRGGLAARPACRPESRSSRMQSGIAPWPGSTTRSAARTSSGRERDDHLDAAALRPTCMHRLRHRAQVAHAVVDDGDGRVMRQLATERALGRRHDAGRARIELQRHAQRAREGLEHRLALVVRVVAAAGCRCAA